MRVRTRAATHTPTSGSGTGWWTRRPPQAASHPRRPRVGWLRSRASGRLSCGPCPRRSSVSRSLKTDPESADFAKPGACCRAGRAVRHPGPRWSGFAKSLEDPRRDALRETGPAGPPPTRADGEPCESVWFRELPGGLARRAGTCSFAKSLEGPRRDALRETGPAGPPPNRAHGEAYAGLWFRELLGGGWPAARAHAVSRSPQAGGGAADRDGAAVGGWRRPNPLSQRLEGCGSRLGRQGGRPVSCRPARGPEPGVPVVMPPCLQGRYLPLWPTPDQGVSARRTGCVSRLTRLEGPLQ